MGSVHYSVNVFSHYYVPALCLHWKFNSKGIRHSARSSQVDSISGKREANIHIYKKWLVSSWEKQREWWEPRKPTDAVRSNQGRHPRGGDNKIWPDEHTGIFQAKGDSGVRSRENVPNKKKAWVKTLVREWVYLSTQHCSEGLSKEWGGERQDQTRITQYPSSRLLLKLHDALP